MKTEKQAQQFGIPEFTTRTGNPDRRRILEGVRRIREGIDPKPKTLGSGGGFGGVMLTIPEFDFAVIRRMFPDLASRDHEIRRKAWLRFRNSVFSEPYRVDRIKRGPQCRSITAR